ncbi:MAG: hypothetical protein HUJ95_01925, partial [Bacteroidales bacterium]|nr:hypothetical protein [Bacteroidales bacterium]
IKKNNSLISLREAERERRERLESVSNVITPTTTPNAVESVLDPIEEKSDITPPVGWIPAKPVERSYTYRFEVTGTKEQLTALRRFYDDIGIEWKKI